MTSMCRLLRHYWQGEGYTTQLITAVQLHFLVRYFALQKTFFYIFNIFFKKTHIKQYGKNNLRLFLMLLSIQKRKTVQLDSQA